MINRKIRITDNARLNNAKAALALIPTDGTVEVVFRQYVKNRSLAQNNLLHMWRKDISTSTGENLSECRLRLAKTHMLPILLSSEEAKDRDIQLTILRLRNAYKVGHSGEVEFIFNQYMSLLSSKDLNVKQFAEFLTEIERECTEQEISLRRPEDYHFALGYSDG